MPRLIWSRAALLDVQRVYQFLAFKNKEAAKKAIATIHKAIKKIKQHPEIGKPVDDMPTEYREWVISFGDSGYVALYRYDGNESVILAIKHQKEMGY